MGASFGSVQLFCQAQKTVRDVLEEMATKRKAPFWLGPALGNWTGVYPVHQGIDPSVARDLARKLGGELFYLMVHRDDVFAYEYYRDGKRLDQYCSRPDFFTESTAAARKSLRGRPEKFPHLAADPERFAQFQQQIAEQAEQPIVFASELLDALASALGMANVATSYEYLTDGQSDVEGWDQFLHVPDLRTEQARSRKADAAHQQEVRRLMDEGLLLAERGGQRGRDVPFLHWCPAADDAGFLLVAQPPEFTREPVPIERIGPPWSIGPKPIGLSVDPNIHALVSSPSGRFVAACCLNFGPNVSVWDLADHRCVATPPRSSHPAHTLTFLPDDSAIVCNRFGMESAQITIEPLASGEPRSFPWPLSLTTPAVHPNGRSVVVIDARNRLSVLHLPSGRFERTLFIGGVGVPIEALRLLGNDFPDDWLTISDAAIDELVRRKRDELADAHGKMVRKRSTENPSAAQAEPAWMELGKKMLEERGSPEQIGTIERDARAALTAARAPGWVDQNGRSRESVNEIAFDAGGDRLFAATSGGLRVYRWRDCLEADAEMPDPVFAIDAGTMVQETADGNLSIGGAIATLAHDPDRDWLLFGGADGRVRFLDLASGLTGTLLEPPGLRPIGQLTFSRDRTVLGLSCGTNMVEDFSRRPMRSAAAVQFWNYRALRERVVVTSS